MKALGYILLILGSLILVMLVVLPFATGVAAGNPPTFVSMLPPLVIGGLMTAVGIRSINRVGGKQPKKQ